MSRSPTVGGPRRACRPVASWRTALLAAVAVSGAISPAHAAEPAGPGPVNTVEAVVVTANKLNVETLIDRKVYTVETDLQSTFGSVSDVLAVIPSVDVDPDGNVSLRGESNVLILIDGRPSAQFWARPPATTCSRSRPRISSASRSSPIRRRSSRPTGSRA